MVTHPIQNARDQIKVKPDKGAMVGQVFSITMEKPLSNMVVRLAQVFWNEDKSEGAYVLEGATSPGDDTDDEGIFVFNDLSPADYVIVVGDIMGDYEIISEADGKAKIYTIEAGSILQVEQLKVHLPQAIAP